MPPVIKLANKQVQITGSLLQDGVRKSAAQSQPNAGHACSLPCLLARIGTMLMQPQSRATQRFNAAHAKFKQDDGPLMPASLRWAKDLRTRRQRQPLQQPPWRRIPKPRRHLAASARPTTNRQSRCKIWRKYCVQQAKPLTPNPIGLCWRRGVRAAILLPTSCPVAAGSLAAMRVHYVG